jgi:hypothetical protein
MNCVPVGEYFGDELVKVWIWSEGALGHQLLATGGALCQPEKHQTCMIASSVADPRMFIPDPDFFPSQIPDTTRTKKGGKYFFVLLFLFEKVQNTLDFEILNISDLCDSHHQCFRSRLDPDSIGTPDTGPGKPK